MGEYCQVPYPCHPLVLTSVGFNASGREGKYKAEEKGIEGEEEYEADEGRRNGWEKWEEGDTEGSAGFVMKN